MVTTQAQPSNRPTATEQARGVWLKWAVILAFAGVALVYGSKVLTARHVPGIVYGLTSAAVLVAVLTAIPRRWASITGLVLGTLLLLVTAASPLPLYAVFHPAAEQKAFAPMTIVLGLNLIGVVAGLICISQLRRGRAVPTPLWAAPVVSGVTGLVLGILLLGTTASFSDGSVTAVAASAHTEVVQVTSNTFVPDIVALHTGDTLSVVDNVQVPHILANGSWSPSGDQAHPATEAGAPVINNVDISSNTKVFGPFTTPGTYHIYCTVHPGMNLTIIVQ